MTRIGAITFILLTASCQIASAELRHPLDALEADEITRAAAILRTGGHSDDETPILSLVLEAPDKSDVLAWKTGDVNPVDIVAPQGGNIHVDGWHVSCAWV